MRPAHVYLQTRFLKKAIYLRFNAYLHDNAGMSHTLSQISDVPKMQLRCWSQLKSKRIAFLGRRRARMACQLFASALLGASKRRAQVLCGAFQLGNVRGSGRTMAPRLKEANEKRRRVATQAHANRANAQAVTARVRNQRVSTSRAHGT